MTELCYRGGSKPQGDEPGMTATTPHLDETALPALASRYVSVPALPWERTQWAGVEMKILLRDEATGLMTALVRMQPGATLPLHEHTDIEQTYVLEGSLADDEGEVRAGDYVWRPKGNRHVAHAPNGALVLSFFLSPNRFLGEA